MRSALLRHTSVFGAGLLLLSACGGGGGGGGSRLSIAEVSNGFGKMLPHQIARVDANGFPTSELIEVTSVDQILANATLGNPVKPPPEWPEEAVLPNGAAGNHYIVARFNQPLDPETVLSSSTADAPGSIGPYVRVQSVDPLTGDLTVYPGRVFLGGRTYGPDTLPGDPTRYQLETWVEVGATDPVSGLTALSATLINGEQPGFGFPGTQPGSEFAGAQDLLDPSALVFVLDRDGDLSTLEAFPTGASVQMRIDGGQVRPVKAGVFSSAGAPLTTGGVAAATVGPDTVGPEVQVVAGSQDPMVAVRGPNDAMIPAPGALDVDPQTDVIIQFTEPMDISRIGSIDNGNPPLLSASILLSFGPSNARVAVPFTVRPVSAFDLTRFVLNPTYDFPGTGPELPNVPCDTLFGQVDMTVAAGLLRDLLGNPNGSTPSCSFRTREGPGIVNAPVTPDAIYLGRSGSNPGISVIDLNGFGAGTGNPTYELEHPIQKGNSNYPNNPNVALNGALLIPPLAPGTCTFNGGSAGAFTLTKDSSLRDLVASKPLLLSVGDMAIGHALDNTFNNATPFGCQSGGGNICAQSGLKMISLIAGGPNTVASANIATIAPIKSDSGVENLVSWAPHPNPPPLIFPPTCLSPLIGGQEPTSILTTCAPTPVGGCNFTYGAPFSGIGGPTLSNLLVPGPFPLGLPEIELPPQGTLTTELNSFFEGPSIPQPNVNLCQPYMIRQQVGQFLYVVDRVAREIVVFNSNRFTVLDRIPVLDPTSLAMGPNLDLLAVTSEQSDLVFFIDIDPGSPSFHQVVKTTVVGSGPSGITWETGNEDIFVCNQGDNTISIISGFTLEVRKVLRNGINRPVEIALTPRQQTFGFLRGVYFGYILNQNGTLSIFESGPDGINGWGYDDVVSTLPFRFNRPKTLQVDPTNLNSAVWIVHEDPLDPLGNPRGDHGGALSNVAITAGFPGIVPLDPGPFSSPSLRDLTFSVLASVGESDGLDGIPVDIAFDNMRNLSALTNYSTTFSPGNPLSYNGKSLVRVFGVALQANSPLFMFAAVPNARSPSGAPGAVAVFDMTGGSFSPVDTDPFVPGVQPIAAPNVNVLADFFRQ